MTPPEVAPARRRRLLVAAAVLAALAVAAVSGWYPYAKLAPAAPSATLRPGESAELDGVRYRLERFVVAPSLPADDPEDPPVPGPDGSALVLVVVSQTVLDRSVRLDEHYCDATLVDGSTVWETDSDVTSLVARPAAFGCSDSDDAPLRYDVPRETGFTFLVPADAGSRVSGRLRVTDGPTLALVP